MRPIICSLLLSFAILLAAPTYSASQKLVEEDSSSVILSTAKAAENWLYIEDAAPYLSPEGRIPILMVHGWNFAGKPAPPGGSYWGDHVKFLLNDAELSKYFKPYYIKYWSNAVSVNDLGGLLRDAIQDAGLHEKPFILIGHSMGGLVSRSFMNEHIFTRGKYAGTTCGELVKQLITLGTPHHGSPMANGPARDEKVDFFLSIYMAAIENFVFSDTRYNEINRSDLRWDNYDNLFNYTKYPAERNNWLINLNAQTQFDSKIICYGAMVTGEFLLPPYDSNDKQYKVGSWVQQDIFGFNNDGIVPIQSAVFEGHTTKRTRFFNEHNHTDIGKGKGEDQSIFFATKEDYLGVVPPQLLWPTEAGIVLKHSETKEIRWESPSTMSAVNIYFSGDNGQTFTKIADNYGASSGSYLWSVPDTNLTQCIIRITKKTNENEYTQSENPFTIYHNRLTFANPVTRSYFVPDKTNTISWNQTGISGKVKISYSDTKNGIAEIIADEITVNQQTNTFEWLPDDSLPPTDSAQIVIEMLGMETYDDTTSYIFRSVPFLLLGLPQITALSPSAFPTDAVGIQGEKLIIDSVFVIRWQTEGEIKFVRISLCDSAKNTIKEVRIKYQSPGIHYTNSSSWKIPELYGDKYYFLLEAGLNESTITTSTYTPYSFRINHQSKILSPENESTQNQLLPYVALDALPTATAYRVAIKDSFSSGEEYNRTFHSTNPVFCLPGNIENELVPGKPYQLTAWAMFDTIASYASQINFRTEESSPGLFSLVAPVNGDTLWDDMVNYVWNRSVGATEYTFNLKYKGRKIYTQHLERSDTTVFVNMNTNGYSDTLFWEVIARNPFGEESTASYFFNKDRVGITLMKEIDKNTFGLRCYPNPVDNESFFEFHLPTKSQRQHVSLSIFNLSGQRMDVLLDESLESGKHKVKWDKAENGIFSLEGGIYFSVLNVDGIIERIKIIMR